MRKWGQYPLTLGQGSVRVQVWSKLDTLLPSPKGRGVSLALIILILASSSTLYAQSRDIWISGGTTDFSFPYFHTNRNLGSSDPSGARDQAQIGDGWRIAFRLAFNTNGSFGHEFQSVHSRPTFIDNTGDILGSPGSDRMKIHQFGYNFLYYFASRESPVRPLATIGVHFSNFVLPDSASAKQDSDMKWGLNYGLGVKWRITPLLGLRGDLRAFETGKPNWGGTLVNQSGLLHQIEASAGVGFYF